MDIPFSKEDCLDLLDNINMHRYNPFQSFHYKSLSIQEKINLETVRSHPYDYLYYQNGLDYESRLELWLLPKDKVLFNDAIILWKKKFFIDLKTELFEKEEQYNLFCYPYQFIWTLLCESKIIDLKKYDFLYVNEKYFDKNYWRFKEKRRRHKQKLKNNKTNKHS